jgi:hypothetical protein
MSDMGLEAPDIEAPDVDAAEQHQEVLPDPDDDNEPLQGQEPPLEADEADAAEQAEVVIPEDTDEYRLAGCAIEPVVGLHLIESRGHIR